MSALLQSDEGAPSMVIVLIDGHAAVIDRLRDGTLTRLHTVSAVTVHGESDHMGDPPRQQAHAGTRGTTATDAAEIARRAAHRRLLAAALRHVIASVSGDECVVIGGTPALADQLRRGLPPRIAARAVVRHGLHPRLSAVEVIEQSDNAARELRRASDVDAVHSLIERTGAHTTGVVGVVAAIDAAERGAVETLYVTPGFRDRHANDAAHAAERTLRHRGRVQYVDGDAAQRLDADAGGIGAALRYALHAAPR